MELHHDFLYAAVSAREDVDGQVPKVVYTPNRCADERVEVVMDPAEARRLARALNRAVKRLA